MVFELAFLTWSSLECVKLPRARILTVEGHLLKATLASGFSGLRILKNKL